MTPITLNNFTPQAEHRVKPGLAVTRRNMFMKRRNLDRERHTAEPKLTGKMK
jgi:hypothetical protein